MGTSERLLFIGLRVRLRTCVTLKSRPVVQPWVVLQNSLLQVILCQIIRLLNPKPTRAPMSTMFTFNTRVSLRQRRLPVQFRRQIQTMFPSPMKMKFRQSTMPRSRRRDPFVPLGIHDQCTNNVTTKNSVFIVLCLIDSSSLFYMQSLLSYLDLLNNSP